MIERFDEQDGVDLERILGRVHERVDGFAPGGLTRSRRARVGAWSVAGVAAVAAAGLVVSGVLAPDDGASSQVAPAVATAAPTASSPVPTPSQAGIRGEAVVYLTKARSAVAELDLEHMIVSVTTKDGAQHPDERALRSGVTRDVYAGDGSASRWTNVADVPGAATDDAGAEEVKKAVPGAKDGRLTYWYVSPRVGAYATFPVGPGSTSPSRSDLVVDWLGNLRNMLKTVEGMAALDGVTSSAPTAATVDGRPAVCIHLSGKATTSRGWSAQDSGGDVAEAVAEYRAMLAKLPEKERERAVARGVLDWTSRTCFDRETLLPVLNTYSYHYQLDEYDAPSLRVKTVTYEWLPRNTTTEKLLEPDLKGLRRVSRHELGVLETK